MITAPSKAHNQASLVDVYYIAACVRVGPAQGPEIYGYHPVFLLKHALRSTIPGAKKAF